MFDSSDVFADQTALVVGGSRNIGADIAAALGNGGAKVAVFSRSPLANVDPRIQALCEGDRSRYYSVDVADRSALRSTLSDLKQDLGEPSIFVFCPVQRSSSPITAINDVEWDGALRVNVDSFRVVLSSITPFMMSQRYGRIVALTGDAAHVGMMNQAIIGATKSALEALIRSAAVELGPYEITANSISPGIIATQRIFTSADQENEAMTQLKSLVEPTPLGRLGTPEEVAHLALFLCSPESSYVTGQVMHVNGGLYLGS